MLTMTSETKIFLVILTLLIASCSFDTGGDVKTAEDVPAWFSANEVFLEETVSLLRNHPSIRRIDPPIFNWGKERGKKRYSPQDEMVHETILEEMSTLGIQVIQVSSSAEFRIYFDVYINYRYDYILSVAYIPEKKFVESIGPYENFRWKFQELPNQHWYIVEVGFPEGYMELP